MQRRRENVMKMGNIIALGALICSSVMGLSDFSPDTAKQPQSQMADEKENLYISLSDRVNPEMIWVVPGIFMMGTPNQDKDSVEIQHQVTLTRGFWLGKYEVTQAQYQTVMGINPSHFKGDNLPVENVSWNDATNFCAKLTEIEKAAGRLPEGYEYTLPTEAQWEYACRAGTSTELNSGKNLTDWTECPNVDELGWYGCNSNKQTHPVGQKKPNAWGFYDMSGNVWEWCLDWYEKYSPEAVTDPAGPANGAYRVLRGGGWYNNACICRSAYRYNRNPSRYYSNIGFRVVLTQI